MVTPRSRWSSDEGGADLVRDVGIEAGRGLVEEQDLGVVQEGLAEVEARLLTGRERSRHAVPGLGDLEQLEERPDLLPRPPHAVEPREHVQVLVGREVEGQADVGGGEVDALQDRVSLARQVQAQDSRRACGRRGEAQQHLERGRLPRSVRAQETQDLPAVGLEGHAVHGDNGSEALGEARHLEDTFGHGGSIVGGPQVMAGNGTVGLEVLEDLPEVAGPAG